MLFGTVEHCLLTLVHNLPLPSALQCTGTRQRRFINEKLLDIQVIQPLADEGPDAMMPGSLAKRKIHGIPSWARTWLTCVTVPSCRVIASVTLPS